MFPVASIIMLTALLSSCGWLVPASGPGFVGPGVDDKLTPDPTQLANFAWVAQYGDGGSDEAKAIATDAAGNVIMTGFVQTYTSDPQQFRAFWRSEIIVAKHSPEGQQMWVRRTAAGNKDSCFGSAIAADAQGNVYVAGVFADSVNFQGVPLRSAGKLDMFLAKYTAEGRFLWVRRFGGRNSDSPRSLAVDAAGRVYMAGVFNEPSLTVFTSENADGFLIQFNADGVQQWAKTLAGTDDDFISSVTISARGDMYCAGTFSGQATLGDVTMTNINSSSYVSSGFVAKFTPNGQVLWARNTEGSYAGFDAVSADNQGNVSVTGSFNNTISLAGQSFTGTSESDIFIAKFSSSGSKIWAYNVGGQNPKNRNANSRSEGGNSIVTDGNGNIYVSGKFAYLAKFGSVELIERGYESPFIVKYDPQGTALWGKVGDYLGHPIPSLAVTPSGTVYVTGAFRATTLFGASTLTSDDGTDIFLGKLLP